MSSIRKTKKDIAFLTGEVISNCYMAIYFQPESAKESIVSVIEKAVDLHNTLIEKTNNIPEKHNHSLTRKHFKTIETQLVDGVDEMFEQISTICQSK